MRKIVLLITAFLIFFSSKSFSYTLFTFEGEYIVPQKSLDLTVNFSQVGKVGLKVKNENNQYHLSLDLDHLKTPYFDLSSQIQSMIEIGLDSESLDNFIKGKIWSQYSIVDYKPGSDLKGEFTIKDHKFSVHDLSLGQVKCDGYIGLNFPYELNLDLEFNALGMKEFLKFWNPNKNLDSEGDIFGEIKVSGSVSEIGLKGNLESKDGHIKSVVYDRLVLKAQGIYPHIYISDSMVDRSNGMSLSFDGPFDLSNQDSFKQQIKALTFEPMINNTASQKEWTFRRIKAEDSSTIEFKYLLRQDEQKKSSDENKDSALLGVERSIQF